MEIVSLSGANALAISHQPHYLIVTRTVRSGPSPKDDASDDYYFIAMIFKLVFCLPLSSSAGVSLFVLKERQQISCSLHD